MDDSSAKLMWQKPELFILEFNKTASGPLTGPNEDGEYSGSLEGS
jgi:hypothetical protein